jgi:hypothetical protein
MNCFASGSIAVARPIQGISPKHCSLPAAGPRAFGDVLIPQVSQPIAALENPMSVTSFACPARRLDPGRANTRFMVWFLAGALGFAGMTPAMGAPVCKPVLTFKDVQFSAMQKPTLERRWTATVSADASRCATTAGYFEAGFSRLKETGAEVEFREQFIWSAPSVMIGVDFWADEAVESYWIDSIQACPCAK